MKSHLVSLCVAFALALPSAGAALADSPDGTWLRADTSQQLSVYDCDSGLGMKITKDPKAENVGKTVMCGAKSSGTNTWDGMILDLANGHRYPATVTMTDANTLNIKACAAAGLVCNSGKLTRVQQ